MSSSAPDANATLVTETPEHKQLVSVIQASELSADSVPSILLTFEPLLQKANKWASQVDTVKVTDASQTLEMRMAREMRLGLREIRVTTDKERKRLKEQSLRQGRAIDGAANIIKALIEPLEQRLQDQEDFIERQETARRGKLKTERETLLSPLAVSLSTDISMYPLGDMPQDSFDILLQTMTTQVQAKKEAAEKAEKDRMEALRVEAEKREAIRIENERLKAEAAKLAKERAAADEALAKERQKAVVEAKRLKDEADAKLKKERDLAEAAAKKLRDENEAKAKAEKVRADAELAETRKAAQAAATKLRDEAFAAEERARKEREAREKLEKEQAAAEKARDDEVARVAAASKAAASAPDKVKLASFVASIRALSIPTFITEPGKAFAAVASDQLVKMAAWAEKQGKTL